MISAPVANQTLAEPQFPPLHPPQKKFAEAGKFTIKNCRMNSSAQFAIGDTE
jgi:hypothetical protein